MADERGAVVAGDVLVPVPDMAAPGRPEPLLATEGPAPVLAGAASGVGDWLGPVDGVPDEPGAFDGPAPVLA
ncbi:MAG: hypothetical protein ACYCST_07230, partial [Acidimicrobiales bacterium]